MLRALWPVFAAVVAVAVGATVLTLKSMFTTTDQHQGHHHRICEVETFVTEQRTAIGILPSRQQLGDQIARQGDRIVETREELGEGISELGERVAGLEAEVKGIGGQMSTMNTYLHTLIERGFNR